MSFTFAGKFVIRLNKFVKSYTAYIEYKHHPAPTSFSSFKVAVVRHIFPAKVQFDTIRFMPCLLLDQWQPKGMHDLP